MAEPMGSYSDSCWMISFRLRLGASTVTAGLVPAIHPAPSNDKFDIRLAGSKDF
jgi:hypothetical protein